MGLFHRFDFGKVVGFKLGPDSVSLFLAIEFILGEFASEPILFFPQSDDFELVFVESSADPRLGLLELVVLPLEEVLELSDFEFVEFGIAEVLPLETLQLSMELAASLADLGSLQVLQLGQLEPQPLVFAEKFLDLEVLPAGHHPLRAHELHLVPGDLQLAFVLVQQLRELLILHQQLAVMFQYEFHFLLQL